MSTGEAYMPRYRVFICGEGGWSGPACSWPSAGIPIGSNCGGDLGAESLGLIQCERWNFQQCFNDAAFDF